MLPGLTVPASLAGVLQVLRGSFTAPSFATFTLWVVGIAAQTGPRTVSGILLGAGLQAVVSHHRVQRFFSVNRWSAEADGNRTRLSRGAAHTGFEDWNSSENVDTSSKVAHQRVVFSNISKNIGLHDNGSNGDSVPASVPAPTAVASPAV